MGQTRWTVCEDKTIMAMFWRHKLPYCELASGEGHVPSTRGRCTAAASRTPRPTVQQPTGDWMMPTTMSAWILPHLKTQALSNTLIAALQRPQLATPRLPNHKISEIINAYCFKLLSMWQYCHRTIQNEHTLK